MTETTTATKSDSVPTATRKPERPGPIDCAGEHCKNKIGKGANRVLFEGKAYHNGCAPTKAGVECGNPDCQKRIPPGETRQFVSGKPRHIDCIPKSTNNPNKGDKKKDTKTITELLTGANKRSKAYDCASDSCNVKIHINQAAAIRNGKLFHTWCTPKANTTTSKSSSSIRRSGTRTTNATETLKDGTHVQHGNMKGIEWKYERSVMILCKDCQEELVIKTFMEKDNKAKAYISPHECEKPKEPYKEVMTAPKETFGDITEEEAEESTEETTEEPPKATPETWEGELEEVLKENTPKELPKLHPLERADCISCYLGEDHDRCDDETWCDGYGCTDSLPETGYVIIHNQGKRELYHRECVPYEPKHLKTRPQTVKNCDLPSCGKPVVSETTTIHTQTGTKVFHMNCVPVGLLETP